MDSFLRVRSALVNCWPSPIPFGTTPAAFAAASAGAAGGAGAVATHGYAAAGTFEYKSMVPRSQLHAYGSPARRQQTGRSAPTATHREAVLEEAAAARVVGGYLVAARVVGES